jgi:hypothetical protein
MEFERAARHELTGHLVLVVEDDFFIAEEIVPRFAKGRVGRQSRPDIEHGRMLMNGRPDCAVLDVNLTETRVSARRRASRAGRAFSLRHRLRRHVPADGIQDAVYLRSP